MQPTIFNCFCSCVGTVPVTANEHGSRHHDFAVLVWSQNFFRFWIPDCNSHGANSATRRGRAIGVELANVAWSECIRFGHAVAQLRASLLHTLCHFVNKCRGCWCTAAAYCAKRRGVVLLEIGVIDEVPALRGNTNEVSDLLILNNWQRLTGIPLVHDDQFQSSKETAEHDGHTTGDVEQRHDENERWRE